MNYDFGGDAGAPRAHDDPDMLSHSSHAALTQLSHSPWLVCRHTTGGPEVSMMILDHYDYTQNATALARYFPIVSLTIDFFRQHYKNRTAAGATSQFSRAHRTSLTES